MLVFSNPENPETVLSDTTLLQRVLRAHARASISATPPNALEMPCDGDSTDEQKLTTTSNTFWSTQTAKYPNYGTTKKRRFHEINYLVENIQKMKEGDVLSLTDVGCGTGSTVTVLQELTDIKKYHCYDISPAMISTIDTSSKRGAHVQTTVMDFTSIDASYAFPDTDVTLCFGVLQCLSDADSRALLERLKGKTAFLRDACYLPHEGRRDVNTFSEQLNANYACRYRTLTEYISLCTDSGWKLKDIRRAFPDEIESAYGTKQWFLHLEK